MQGGVQGGLVAVYNPLFYWSIVVVANRNLLRVKDDGRQGKAYRNEKAIESQ